MTRGLTGLIAVCGLGLAGLGLGSWLAAPGEARDVAAPGEAAGAQAESVVSPVSEGGRDQESKPAAQFVGSGGFVVEAQLHADGPGGFIVVPDYLDGWRDGNYFVEQWGDVPTWSAGGVRDALYMGGRDEVVVMTGPYRSDVLPSVQREVERLLEREVQRLPDDILGLHERVIVAPEEPEGETAEPPAGDE